MNHREQDAWLSESVDRVAPIGLTRVRLRDCVVDVDLNRITAPHGETALEPKAMAVLAYLIDRPGAVVGTGELIDAVWLGRPMGDNPVYRCIAQLRRALGDNPRAPAYIATVPTKGYRLIAAVETLDRAAALPGSALPEPAPALEPEPATPVPLLPPPRARPRHPWFAVGLPALALLLMTLAVLSWQQAPDTRSAPTPAAPATLAVLPLHAATHDETGNLLAQNITESIRRRIARSPDLIVLASSATADVTGPAVDIRATARRLHARYLLRGELTPIGARLRVAVQLLDGQTGKPLWSSTLERPSTEAAAIRDDIARNLAGVLHIAPGFMPERATVEAATQLDAWQVYRHARKLLQGASAQAAGEAVELFRRATILDPEFALAYLGLGQALAPSDPAAATQAFERALALDPAMGEAWVGLAQLASDPAQAEAQFRKGLALAPSDGDGHASYARFLFHQARPGEAIPMIARARRIDPLEPTLYLTEAFFVMVVRSDVAEHDRLVRQALEIDPRLPAALYQLAYSKWEYSGEFAEAARLAEQAIAVAPSSLPARMLARDIQLDLDDPAAATTVLGPEPLPIATLELAQYRGDRVAAAAVLRDLAPADWPDAGPQAAKAQAVRDAAIGNGQLAAATRRLQAVQAVRAGRLPMTYRGFSLVYAHALALAGDVQGGKAQAGATLALVDAHGIARSPHWFSRERAAAFAVLGDDAKALQELAHSIENGQLYRWWYLARHDPLFAGLRNDPRFQALDQLARAHRDRQRALLAAMRRQEGFPWAPPAVSAAR